MARKPRVQYPGAIYHVMNRGDRREAIFYEDGDRVLFIETLAEACEKTEWRVLAYCLMENHFHAVVETPLPNLVAGTKWFLGTYTTEHANQLHERKAAAGLLSPGLGIGALVLGRIGEADRGAIDDFDPQAGQRVKGQPVPRLTIGAGAGIDAAAAAEGTERLDLAHHLAARAVGVEDLVEKAKKGAP
jgi:REP element-mobilizing transposase RayT